MSCLIRLDKDHTFVRVHGEKNRAREWVMRPEEIEGLTPKQIKDKFALPSEPTHISEVKVPSGTKIRLGTAGEQTGWGKGGGTQYELLADDLSKINFKNTRPLE